MLNLTEAPIVHSSRGERMGSHIVIHGTPIPLLMASEKQVFKFLQKFPDGDFEMYQKTMHWNVTRDVFDKVKLEMQARHDLPPTPERVESGGSENRDRGTQIALSNYHKKYTRRVRVTLNPDDKLGVIKWIRSHPEGKFADCEKECRVPHLKKSYFYALRSEYLDLSKKKLTASPAVPETPSSKSSSLHFYQPIHKGHSVGIPSTLGKTMQENLKTLSLKDLRLIGYKDYQEKFPNHGFIPTRKKQDAAMLTWSKKQELKRRGKKGFGPGETIRYKMSSAKPPKQIRTGKIAYALKRMPLEPQGVRILCAIPCAGYTPEQLRDLKKIIPEILTQLNPGSTFKCVQIDDGESQLEIRQV